MSGNIRLPNIHGTTSSQQLAQIKSYLYQLVEQLNYSLKDIDTGSSRVVMTVNNAGTSAEKKNEAASTFNSIKALIIKSADVVNAYYDVINKRLEGLYVAESDFGTYTQKTTQDIKANSDSITSLYTNIQTITSNLKEVQDALIEVNAYIESGHIDDDENGVPIYGLEIGQKTEIDGKEVFNKFARFTSDMLAFYDQNDPVDPVAYISDMKLYITHIEVKGSYQMGGFMDTVQSDGSIVTKWIGYGGDE